MLVFYSLQFFVPRVAVTFIVHLEIKLHGIDNEGCLCHNRIQEWLKNAMSVQNFTRSRERKVCKLYITKGTGVACKYIARSWT
jgi:hypothetical protein